MDVTASAQDMFDRGLAAVKGAVSGAAVELQPFMAGFVRLCSDGWLQGWHECNGGNLTYRMTADDVKACRPFFSEKPGEWVGMDVKVANVGGSFFATTAAGSFMRNVQLDVAGNVGIVEVNGAGDAWRTVWGFKDGGRPTSEFPSHLMTHGVRMEATGGASRVLYHAHPDNVIALTKVVPLDARSLTRALWKAATECIMVLPMGVGVVPCMVPGGPELARATSELMKTYEAVVWAQHGLFCSGPDFDATFGLMHSIDKAAHIHGLALAMNGGSGDFANTISDDDLRAIAESLGLKANEAFLD